MHQGRLCSAVLRQKFTMLSGCKHKSIKKLTWSRMCERGISFIRRRATPICDSGESKLALVGVLTISAPNALSTSTWWQTQEQFLVNLEYFPSQFRNSGGTVEIISNRNLRNHTAKDIAQIQFWTRSLHYAPRPTKCHECRLANSNNSSFSWVFL